MPHGHRARGLTKHHTWKTDLVEMWTAGYKYSWRKMEAAAENTAGCREEWSVVYVPTT